MTYLTDLADVLRAAGLDVVEIPGWQNRSRPASTGGFNPSGVLVHHTGGTSDTRAYVEWMALTGRPDLPAPLCQLALSRGGTVYVCAAGRANHGGTARASGPMPAGDGNALYIGIEALNTGSEGWCEAQYDAYVSLCAALCRAYGWPAPHVRAHRETSVTGKPDPGLIDMDRFRSDIATALEDDDMAFTEDQLRAIVRSEINSALSDVGEERIENPGEDGPGSRSLNSMLWAQLRAQRNTNDFLRETGKRLERLEESMGKGPRG